MATDMFGYPLDEEERFRLMMEQQRMGLTPTIAPTTTRMLPGPAVDTFIDRPRISPIQQPRYDSTTPTFGPTQMARSTPTFNTDPETLNKALSGPLGVLNQQAMGNFTGNNVAMLPDVSRTGTRVPVLPGGYTKDSDYGKQPGTGPLLPSGTVPAPFYQPGTILDTVLEDPTDGAIPDDYMATVLSNANMDNLYASNATIGPVTATRQGTDWVNPDSQKFGTDQLDNAPVLSHDYMSRDLGLEPVSGYIDGMGMPIHTGLRYPNQPKTAFELAQDKQDFDLATATAVDTFANMPSTGGFFPWPRAEPTGQDAIDEMETTTGIDTFSSGFPSVSPAETGGFKPGFGQLEHSYGTPSASTPSSADINAALSQSFEVPASTMNNQGKFGVPYGVDVSTGEIAPFSPSGISYTGQSAPQDTGIVSVVNALKTITDTIDKAKSVVTPTTSSGVTSVTTPTQAQLDAEKAKAAAAQESERIRVAAEKALATRALEIQRQQQAEKTAAEQTARVRNEIFSMLMSGRDRGEPSAREIDAAIQAMGNEFGGLLSLPGGSQRDFQGGLETGTGAYGFDPNY